VNQSWEEPMPEAKPYNIPKQLVWAAYQRVQANRGAAGVDGESLAAFEQDLKGNLYKVWNRMSSGSYFPPPVRLVETEQDNGGHPRVAASRTTRITAARAPWAFPRWRTECVRRSRKWSWSRWWNPCSIRTPT